MNQTQELEHPKEVKKLRAKKDPKPEPETQGLTGRIVTAAIGVALLVVTMQFPLWQATLHAPQYPAGLKMIAYGDRVAGDVREINGLNHYIGMKPLRWADIPERQLWIPMLLLVAVAAIVGLVARHGLLGRFARIGLWLAPVGVLADIQFRLWQYGHDLYPMAALRIPEFTPWVIGTTKVWNFETVAVPGIGILALFAVAADITFGPKIFRKLHLPKAARPVAAGMLLVAASAVPALAAPHAHHDDTDLQAVLNSAAPGATVSLDPVTYHGNFSITKPVVLEGNGAILHGDGTGSVLTIDARDVTVEGLTVTHSAPGPVGSPAGIAVSGRRISLDRVQVADSYLGIFVEEAMDVSITDSLVEGRTAGGFGDPDHATNHDRHGSYGRSDMSEGRGDGIAVVNSDDVVIRDNTVSGVRDGLYLSWVQDALLDSNAILDSRYGVHSMFAHGLTAAGNSLRQNVAGMVYMYGSRVLVLDNHLFRNRSATTGFGLLVKDVTDFEAAKNVIEGNRIGIQIEGPAGAAAEKQTFVLNTVALNGIGAAILPSASATLTGNSFVENHLQVLSVGQVAAEVRWTHHGAGNYWSDYRGFDRNSDGVGEVTYRSAGITSRLLDENPALYALMGTPAFNMTSAAQQRWMSADSAILDELPLMEPHSPGVPARRDSDGSVPLALGAGIAALTAALLVAARRLKTPTPLRRLAQEMG